MCKWVNIGKEGIKFPPTDIVNAKIENVLLYLDLGLPCSRFQY